MTFSDQLREAIRGCGMSMYVLSKASGVDQAVLSRFLNRKSGLSSETIDRLCRAIRFKVTAQ